VPRQDVQTSSTAVTGPARPRKRSRLREDRGQALVITAGALVPLLIIAAFVVDIGQAYWAKRALQRSADAAALAGAQDLPNGAQARASAYGYSGRSDGRNHSITGTVTRVCVPGDTSSPEPVPPRCGQAHRVSVRERATIDTFFARVFGVGSITVNAQAVAARPSTTTTTPGAPIAVYVHELCGNKGFMAGGDNMRIEGGIHSNGNFEVKNPGFVSTLKSTRYRSPYTGPPAQRSGCKDVWPSSASQNGSAAPPSVVNYRPWVTPYHQRSDVEAGAPCTHRPSGDIKFDNQELTAAQQGVYCLAAGKKFTLAGNVRGPGNTPARLTVLADLIEVGGTGKLAPYCEASGSWPMPSSCRDETPVLFYNTGGGPWPAGSETPSSWSIDIIVNPSAAYDWTGYIINRRGGIKINAAGVTSPLKGLLEAEYVDINGANFTMLGTHPDPNESTETTVPGDITWEE
jgi:hypothetical protein